MDFSSIFIKKTEYSIQRIEKKDDGWKLYPENQSEQPIFISQQQYAGKMPSSFKLFLKKRNLVLKRYENFIISAELDGVLLFEIKEADYPKKLQEQIAKREQMYQEYLEQCQRDDEQLKTDLAKYLQSLPASKTLEDNLPNLRVPLRVYLKLHLFRGTPSADAEQRLTLMFILSQITERIYKRHVRETDKKYSLDLDCAFAAIRFSPLMYDDIWPDYRFDMKQMEKAVGLEKSHKVYETYYEAEKLIAEKLPPCQENIRRYLNYVVHKLLHLYAEDWNELQANFRRDGWQCSRLYSDEEEYTYRYEKMKLLHYTNFILPEQIPQDKIDDFVNHFNLA